MLAALVLALAALSYWALREAARGPVAIAVPGPRPPGPRPPLPDLRTLTAAGWEQLPGWREADPADAFAAFRGSCANGFERAGASDLAAALRAGRAELERICAAARAVPPDAAAVRAFLERELEPLAVGNRERREGLLTGYYEPLLSGSRRRRAPHLFPLYRAPDDRMVVDLGPFRRELAGRSITGMIRGGRFRPYWERAEIESGALRGRGLELVWVDDPVALFFLQIQGSGRIRFADGGELRVGYAGQNGHDYTAIGRTLVEHGEMALEQVTMQSIASWLRAHPERAAEVMNENRSYVFFRPLAGSAPVGAEGVELTPGRSLAVDDDWLPYGLPLWLDSSLPPTPEVGRADEQPLRRLVVAQDTGGALRGPVRGDLFLGPGPEAEATAGRMKQPLRLWLLWPRGIARPSPADGG